jgi:putative spermidine/putrescine transport system ATP-binding protein
MGDAPATEGQAQTLLLRPEKLRLRPSAEGRLPVRVTERFFLGAQWLYRVSCALGDLDIACPNDGSAPWAEGDEAGLDWADDVARVLPAGSSA